MTNLFIKFDTLVSHLQDWRLILGLFKQ